eukprot:symbB.v1.2.030543.t2/scaffold3453.1/size56350/3
MELADLLNGRKGLKRPAAKRAAHPNKQPKKRPAAVGTRDGHGGDGDGSSNDVEIVLSPYPVPKSAENLSLWAFVLLRRCADLFGVMFVQHKLRTVDWSRFDLFGGCLCIRRAWQMLEAAALEMWGVRTALTFDFNVQKNQACTKLTTNHYPNSCLARRRASRT